MSTTPSIIILCTNYINLIIIIIIISISKSLTQYLSNIPEKNEIKELKKQPYLALKKYYGMC